MTKEKIIFYTWLFDVRQSTLSVTFRTTDRRKDILLCSPHEVPGFQ
jgi:hypothetical protein